MVACSRYLRREKTRDVIFAPGEEELYGMTVAGPATYEQLSKLKILFLHVHGIRNLDWYWPTLTPFTGEAVRVWSFSTPQEEVYVMKKELKIEMPTKFNKKADELLLFLESCWQLLVRESFSFPQALTDVG